MNKNNFKGKDFKILNHTYIIKKTPLVRVVEDFRRDYDTGKPVRNSHGTIETYKTKEYKETNNYVFTFSVLCPDDVIRSFKEVELVNLFGKKSFRRAYKIYYDLLESRNAVDDDPPRGHK